jgi:hypothetical protein
LDVIYFPYSTIKSKYVLQCNELSRVLETYGIAISIDKARWDAAIHAFCQMPTSKYSVSTAWTRNPLHAKPFFLRKHLFYYKLVVLSNQGYEDLAEHIVNYFEDKKQLQIHRAHHKACVSLCLFKTALEKWDANRTNRTTSDDIDIAKNSMQCDTIVLTTLVQQHLQDRMIVLMVLRYLAEYWSILHNEAKTHYQNYNPYKQSPDIKTSAANYRNVTESNCEDVKSLIARLSPPQALLSGDIISQLTSIVQQVEAATGSAKGASDTLRKGSKPQQDNQGATRCQTKVGSRLSLLQKEVLEIKAQMVPDVPVAVSASPQAPSAPGVDDSNAVYAGAGVAPGSAHDEPTLVSAVRNDVNSLRPQRGADTAAMLAKLNDISREVAKMCRDADEDEQNAARAVDTAADALTRAEQRHKEKATMENRRDVEAAQHRHTTAKETFAQEHAYVVQLRAESDYLQLLVRAASRPPAPISAQDVEQLHTQAKDNADVMHNIDTRLSGDADEIGTAQMNAAKNARKAQSEKGHQADDFIDSMLPN